LAWKWSEGRPGKLYSPAACWPVAANDKIFIVAPDRFMTAIDYNTGETVWRTNRFKERETIGISEDGSRIYAQCMQDTVVAVSSKSNRFELLWATHCGYGYDIAPSMLIEKDNVVFFATKNGLIFALDAFSGKVKWHYKFGNTLINTVNPISSKQILFSNMDGNVALLIDNME
jgi:outer membrane protein assembly factor BamB